jgi:hypothetical protein
MAASLAAAPVMVPGSAPAQAQVTETCWAWGWIPKLVWVRIDHFPWVVLQDHGHEGWVEISCDQ